jgi:alpha-aminoadipic semialdehyde synthase
VTDRALFQAGAKVHPTLEPAHIVLGIKETPLDELVTSPVPMPGLGSGSSVPRTHLMFSHTTKGQPYNMELLSRFLSSQENPSLQPRLIDYELLVGGDGKRTVGFGWFAGGMQ